MQRITKSRAGLPKKKGREDMGKNNEWVERKAGEFNETFEFNKKGDTLIGVYRGSREVNTGLGVSVVHTVEVDKDTLNDFWGTGKSNYLLKDIPEGTRIKLVYLGMTEAKVQIGKRKVNKQIHDYQLWTSGTIDKKVPF